MARMREARFKKCRRLGLNVCGHLKAMKREGNGQARDHRKKLSPYGVQLLEKQRLRGYYEVMEKQFRKYVKAAMKGGVAFGDATTGEILVRMLETRLDNIVYRLNFASSIRQARQMVAHGHILVNGHRVDRPSYSVGVGEVISLKEKSKKNEGFKDAFANTPNFLPYLTKNIDALTGSMERYPERGEVPIQINDQLVVEFYSRVV